MIFLATLGKSTVVVGCGPLGWQNSCVLAENLLHWHPCRRPSWSIFLKLLLYRILAVGLKSFRSVPSCLRVLLRRGGIVQCVCSSWMLCTSVYNRCSLVRRFLYVSLSRVFKFVSVCSFVYLMASCKGCRACCRPE